MQKRYEVRRATVIPAEVAAPCWDRPVDLVAVDLSPRGMYLLSEEIPELGEHLFCSFAVGRDHRDYCFLSRVRRINWHRRKNDRYRPGFGVEFLDTSPLKRLHLRDAVRGLPPPLPSKKREDFLDFLLSGR